MADSYFHLLLFGGDRRRPGIGNEANYTKLSNSVWAVYVLWLIIGLRIFDFVSLEQQLLKQYGI
jgi:hypothetical protein